MLGVCCNLIVTEMFNFKKCGKFDLTNSKRSALCSLAVQKDPSPHHRIVRMVMSFG